MREIWHKHWLLRWSVVHALALPLALLIAAMMLWLLGWLGALFSGALMGLTIGTAQAWILFGRDDFQLARRWAFYSAMGGFFGAFPAAFLAIVGLFNLALGIFLIGAAFSALLGLLQSIVLVSLLDERAYLWIPTCLLAGGIAAWLTVPFIRWGLPVCLSPGFLVFGLITGYLLLRWMNTKSTDDA